MDKLFKLKEHNVTFKGEVVAALTSFFAAVYIVIVNASILSDAGIPMEPLIIATVLASLVGCFLVSFLSNTPLVIMPGMGINAFFTYTVVNTMGLNFNQALAAVFVSGVLFVIIAVTPISKSLTDAIPHTLKEAITIGIGLFITFVGLQKAGIVVSDPATFVKMGDIHSKEVLVFVVVMIITLILFIRNIRGAFLISIVVGTIISIVVGIVDITNVNFSLPDFSSYNDIFFKLDFSAMGKANFWIAAFSLSLVIVFENIGLLHGQVSGMLNAPEKTSKALNAVAYSVIGCSLLGTSPTVSTVEGTAGIAEGGKTGLTSFITGLLIMSSLFFIPIIKIIPNVAIAPILIIIGGLMSKNLKYLNFDDLTELFPAFMTIVMIPLTYSIVDGIAFGFVLYPICKLATNKRKDISLAMYIIPIVFVIYFILHGINI